MAADKSRSTSASDSTKSSKSHSLIRNIFDLSTPDRPRRRKTKSSSNKRTTNESTTTKREALTGKGTRSECDVLEANHYVDRQQPVTITKYKQLPQRCDTTGTFRLFHASHFVHPPSGSAGRRPIVTPTPNPVETSSCVLPRGTNEHDNDSTTTTGVTQLVYLAHLNVATEASREMFCCTNNSSSSGVHTGDDTGSKGSDPRSPDSSVASSCQLCSPRTSPEVSRCSESTEPCAKCAAGEAVPMKATLRPAGKRQTKERKPTFGERLLRFVGIKNDQRRRARAMNDFNAQRRTTKDFRVILNTLNEDAVIEDTLPEYLSQPVQQAYTSSRHSAAPTRRQQPYAHETLSSTHSANHAASLTAADGGASAQAASVDTNGRVGRLTLDEAAAPDGQRHHRRKLTDSDASLLHSASQLIGLSPFATVAALSLTFRLEPDRTGRYGFNVKGGIDQACPISISKVTLNTPAHRAVAGNSSQQRGLREGDFLVGVNGLDTRCYTHERVVRHIKSNGAAGLTLDVAVFPFERLPILSTGGNGASTNDSKQQTQPQTGASSTNDRERAKNHHQQQQNRILEPCDELSKSIDSLKRLIYSGGGADVTRTFDIIPKYPPGVTFQASRDAHNVPLNRYRDILCYDHSRVVLNDTGGLGDYINASHVDMKIPTDGVVTRYICAQGPLPHTSAHFWLMVWQQRSPLVLMLTREHERGMTKCHRYWPSARTSGDYGPLKVTCTSESAVFFDENDPAGGSSSSSLSDDADDVECFERLKAGGSKRGCYVRRELQLYHRDTKEKRLLVQLQYRDWPDHGVPESSSNLIKFLFEAIRIRAGSLDPIVVHCSAGIGRTGVFVLLESALAHIEANRPVEPVKIVEEMRRQRANLIQTSEQFRFGLVSIVNLYEDFMNRKKNVLQKELSNGPS